MHLTAILPLIALAMEAVEGREPPPLCMVSPLPRIIAGQKITANVINPQGRPCSATLVFSDPNFLPVNFDIEPILCLGYQKAELRVPSEVPNGEMTVLWECAGEYGQSCSRAIIEGGKADAKGLKRQQTGLIECVVPTATITSLLTMVQDKSTITTAVVTTIFSTKSLAPLISTRVKATNSARSASNGEVVEEGSFVETPTALAMSTVSYASDASDTTPYSTLILAVPYSTTKVESTTKSVNGYGTSSTSSVTRTPGSGYVMSSASSELSSSTAYTTSSSEAYSPTIKAESSTSSNGVYQEPSVETPIYCASK